MDFESRFEIKYNLKDFDEIFIKKNILNSTNLNKIYEDRIINSIYFDTNNFICANDNLSGQSIRSSRNPRNNIDNDSYKAEDCFNLNKSVVLHQDTSTKTYFMVRQNSYKITSKEEHEKMKHF